MCSTVTRLKSTQHEKKKLISIDYFEAGHLSICGGNSNTNIKKTNMNFPYNKYLRKIVAVVDPLAAHQIIFTNKRLERRQTNKNKSPI